MRKLTVAVLSLSFAVACGPRPSTDKCMGVQCVSGTKCDPADGQCKPNSAGGGSGGNGGGAATGGGTGGSGGSGGSGGGATGGGSGGGATGGGSGGGATGGGSGGGATGGGSGGGTMTSDAGCVRVTTWPNGFIWGRGLPGGLSSVQSFKSATAPTEVLTIDAFDTVTYPATVTLTSATTESNCDVCVYLDENCTPGLSVIPSCNGPRAYFGQGGNVSITQTTYNRDAGTYVGNATGLRLYEWDFVNDQRVPDAGCYEIDSFSWNVSWMSAPVDGGSGASAQIAAVRSAADAGPVSLRIAGATVTYVIPTTIGSANDDPAGFFVQAAQTGPAVFVAVDPSTLTPVPAVGDVVDFTATDVASLNALTRVKAITGFTRLSSGANVAALAQNLTAATDTVSALASYESELITVTGVVDGGFGASGSLHQQALFPTAGLSTGTVARFRAPDAVVQSLDLQNGCTFTVSQTPMWRFQNTAQASAWAAADVTNLQCAAPTVVSANATSPTSVTVRFSRRLNAASVLASGAQFTIPGLLVSAAAVSGNDVTLTTATQAVMAYTVTVTNTVQDNLNRALGTPNSATFTGFSCTPNALVISQVYGSGGNNGAVYANDFVELHNRSNASVSLNGLSIQYASNNGTWSALNTHALPNATVAAGGYYLVAFAGGVNGAALPTPDFDRDAGTNLSGASGKLVLVNGTTPITGTCPFDAGVTTVIDFVAYGTTNCTEGANAPGQSAANGSLRGGNGCNDTASNGADFTAAAPAPKNSASTANVCSCP